MVLHGTVFGGQKWAQNRTRNRAKNRCVFARVFAHEIGAENRHANRCEYASRAASNFEAPATCGRRRSMHPDASSGASERRVGGRVLRAASTSIRCMFRRACSVAFDALKTGAKATSKMRIRSAHFRDAKRRAFLRMLFCARRMMRFRRCVCAWWRRIRVFPGRILSAARGPDLCGPPCPANSRFVNDAR